MTNELKSDGLYIGEVVHKRVTPKRHSLRYKVFSLLVDIDALDELDNRLKLFSLNRFNLFSLHTADYGAGDGDLSSAIRRRVRATGLDDAKLRIRMLTYPRIFGYAFNPLTTYFVENEKGEVQMLIYEVHNTFGEKHFYQARVNQQDDAPLTHANPKAFFVSPFNDMQGEYRFTVRPPTDEIFTGIVLRRGGKSILTTYFKGTYRRLNDSKLLQLALAYPFLTAKIIAGIHWEALLLWLKGVPLTLHLRRRTGTHNAAPR